MAFLLLVFFIEMDKVDKIENNDKTIVDCG